MNVNSLQENAIKFSEKEDAYDRIKQELEQIKSELDDWNPDMGRSKSVGKGAKESQGDKLERFLNREIEGEKGDEFELILYSYLIHFEGVTPKEAKKRSDATVKAFSKGLNPFKGPMAQENAENLISSEIGQVDGNLAELLIEAFDILEETIKNKF